MKINDKIDLGNQADMDKLGVARKSGNWIVTNKKRTVVKFIGSEIDAKEFYLDQRFKHGGAYLLPSLRKITITVEDQERYDRIHHSIIQIHNK